MRDYAGVTAAYWAFTLTDGALRMLVLLHFHHLGFSPVELASLFLLYEAMGIVTNLMGGWLGARFGLRLTLLAGLGVQIVALLLLSVVDATWGMALSVAWVMGAQALSGVAKDLTKMSSKSAVKAVVRDEAGRGMLFRWVALLTGSKNALKGVGFFLGGGLLAWTGFAGALYLMAGLLAAVLLVVAVMVQGTLGKAGGRVTRRDMFSKNPQINWLSAARVFLFGSRDVWFVVALPVFLTVSLSWQFDQVGAFMAAWVIGYGLVQAVVPGMLRGVREAAAAARAARLWGALLMLLTIILATGVTVAPSGWFVVVGLLVFGVVFAVNSAVHSYLIVAYSDSDKVALNVGFYYMANAVGRLLGTVLSGVLFQIAGLSATLWASAVMIGLAVLFTLPLVRKPGLSP